MDVFGFTSFLTVLFVFNFLLHLIVQSLKEKPLGRQSIYDLAIQDYFFVWRCYGSYIFILYTLTRVHFIQNLLNENSILLTTVCTFYSFSFTTLCISAGCVCIIRTLCLFKMVFMDETIGEMQVRILSAFVSLFSGFVVALLLLYHRETNTGSFKTMITGQVTKSGKIFLLHALIRKNKRVKYLLAYFSLTTLTS